MFVVITCIRFLFRFNTSNLSICSNVAALKDNMPLSRRSLFEMQIFGLKIELTYEHWSTYSSTKWLRLANDAGRSSTIKFPSNILEWTVRFEFISVIICVTYNLSRRFPGGKNLSGNVFIRFWFKYLQENIFEYSIMLIMQCECVCEINLF